MERFLLEWKTKWDENGGVLILGVNELKLSKAALVHPLMLLCSLHTWTAKALLLTSGQ